MSKIRVLHFTEVINRYDFIDVIIRFADPEKFEMHAASYERKSNIEDPKFDEQNIPYYSLGIKWGYAGLFSGAWRLARLIRKEKIQVLHTHHYYEAVMGRIACWLYPRCRHVVGRHYHNDLYLTTKGLKLRMYLFVESMVNRFAAAIVSPSTKINELLAKQGVPSSKIKFVPYGFDFTAPRYRQLKQEEKRALRKELGVENNFLVGNFSRHHPIKGQLDLLNAFKEFSGKHNEARLIMVGDGPYRGVLNKFVSENGMTDSVIFLGWRKDGHRLMNAMDVIVHSTLQEAFPQTMIEVMALGIPLLICPVSGATDVVQHEKNGILIPFHSPHDIEKYLHKIFSDPAWALGLVKEGEKRVLEFGIRNVIGHYEEVYTNLISG